MHFAHLSHRPPESLRSSSRFWEQVITRWSGKCSRNGDVKEIFFWLNSRGHERGPRWSQAQAKLFQQKLPLFCSKYWATPNRQFFGGIILFQNSGHISWGESPFLDYHYSQLPHRSVFWLFVGKRWTYRRLWWDGCVWGWCPLKQPWIKRYQTHFIVSEVSTLTSPVLFAYWGNWRFSVHPSLSQAQRWSAETKI